MRRDLRGDSSGRSRGTDVGKWDSQHAPPVYVAPNCLINVYGHMGDVLCIHVSPTTSMDTSPAPCLFIAYITPEVVLCRRHLKAMQCITVHG